MSSPIRDCLEDIISHHRAFADGFATLRDAAICDGDKSYWQHQIDVIDRMFGQATRAIDHITSAPPLGRSMCAFYLNQNGVCKLCEVSFIDGHGKPTTCKVNSLAVPPAGDKPR